MGRCARTALLRPRERFGGEAFCGTPFDSTFPCVNGLRCALLAALRATRGRLGLRAPSAGAPSGAAARASARSGPGAKTGIRGPAPRLVRWLQHGLEREVGVDVLLAGRVAARHEVRSQLSRGRSAEGISVKLVRRAGADKRVDHKIALAAEEVVAGHCLRAAVPLWYGASAVVRCQTSIRARAGSRPRQLTRLKHGSGAEHTGAEILPP